VNLELDQESQGQISADVQGGTRSLPPSTPGGSHNGSNLVGLLVDLPPLPSDQTANITPFNPSFQQSKPILVLDGGGKGPNRGIHTVFPLLPSITDIQIDVPTF
jgi:hypothetical protein